MLRTQKAVIGELKRMEDKTIHRMVPSYWAETLGPLLETIRTTENAKDAEKRLNGDLLRRMSTRPLAEALTNNAIQAGLIGRTTVLPRDKKPETGK